MSNEIDDMVDSLTESMTLKVLTAILERLNDLDSQMYQMRREIASVRPEPSRLPGYDPFVNPGLNGNIRYTNNTGMNTTDKLTLSALEEKIDEMLKKSLETKFEPGAYFS